MRKWHYLKSGGRTTAPQDHFVFDVETWHGEKAKADGGELQRFRLACGISFRIEGNRRTRIKRYRSNRRDDIWGWIIQNLHQDRCLWVWAHNAPYDIGAAGLWGRICSSEFGAEKCVLTPSTTWIKGRFNDKPIVFADTCNYLKMPLAEVGKAIGLAKMPMPDQYDDDEAWYRYCENDVEITARAVQALVEFVKTEDLGRWQPTAAGMAMQAFRKRFLKPKSVLVHCNWDAIEIERGAYYGGVVELAKAGKVSDVLFELDVMSMYPHVCRQPLPVKIDGCSDRIGVQTLGKIAQTRMVFAEVDISTNDHTYPVRMGNRTIHARGDFTTCLAHPELVRAIERGHVKWVHRASWYQAEPILAGYMEWGFNKRLEYKDSDKPAFAEFCKLLINGLYGKFGQRSPRWVEWGPFALSLLEREHNLKPGTLDQYINYEAKEEAYEFPRSLLSGNIVVECRNYWGVVEVAIGLAESRDSCPAIAAAVTSYARCLLRDIQACAGKRNWYYSDTDSIWVNYLGLSNLKNAGYVKDRTWGKLDVKSWHEGAIFHAPKDYETMAGIKLKGVKKTATRGEKKMYRQLQFPSAMQQLKKPCPDGVFVSYIEKDLRRTLDCCMVGPDGWTEPFTL